MTSMNSNNFAASAPLGCLSEHLDYFCESIANRHPNLDGDFDDIFGADFDLVFDPDIILGTAAVDDTVYEPTDPRTAPPSAAAASAATHSHQCVQC
jgi:hypothetical protein